MENANPSSPPRSPTSPISRRVRELDKLLEYLGIILPPPTSEPSCLYGEAKFELVVRGVLEDVSSIIDHYLGRMVLGKPFAKQSKITYGKEEGTIMFKKNDEKHLGSIGGKARDLGSIREEIGQEYNFSCHFIGECLNPKENKAFVGAAWSDSEEGVEPQKDAKCLMAINSQENTSHMMNALKEARMESRQMILSIHHGLEMLLDIISKMNKKLEDEKIKVNDRGKRKVNDF
ncbi:hypothetical protein Tco_0640392 [Tanacetum coccineum]